MLTYLTASRRRAGFTLIEMLIVICVIAILAMLVIPRMLAARRHAKEVQLAGNLKQLRDAIERFEATTGAWPPALTDIIAASGAAISADMDGAGGAVDRTAYDGPYLIAIGGGLPADPFTEAADWNYDNASGDIHSSSTLSALDGSDYDTW
jgi:prepilin-type N-terminal cleavage/methylation domain-containing protein